MKFSIYKLSFKTAVHFGNGRLTESGMTFYADTLFSALFKEALKLQGNDGAQELLKMAKGGRLLLSDSMPYYDDTLFLPKPITQPQTTEKRESDSVMKKKFKKLRYIPAEDIDSFLGGSYDPAETADKLGRIGKSSIRGTAAVPDKDDAQPFNIGVFTFGFYDETARSFEKNSGLYFIAGTDGEEAGYLLDDLMDSLSYTGIGGKLSAGLGKFEYTYGDLPEHLAKRLGGGSKQMTLSLCMAQDAELETALDGAEYELIKRSGFVSSDSYADSPQKKRDFYCFKGGSCFENSFSGDVFDVSAGGAHPVYRYAKPMLIGIGKET